MLLRQTTHPSPYTAIAPKNQSDINRAPCLHNDRDCVRRPSCCMLYEGSRSRCTWSWELVDSGNHKSSTSSFQISMVVWGVSERFGRERGCSAMHVAACCAHACSTVAGGKAAAFHGVFQHHTPCVGQIFCHRAGQHDLHSERYASPSLPCPALALHPPCYASFMRTADHPLPRPLQVVIWAVSTPTRTSEYPLPQIYTLVCMVPAISFVNVVVDRACDRIVAGMRCGCPGGGAVRGLFLDLYAHFFEIASLFCVLQ